MSDTVRIYPELKKEQAAQLKALADTEHRTIQAQVAWILDRYLSGRLVEKKEEANA